MTELHRYQEKIYPYRPNRTEYGAEERKKQYGTAQATQQKEEAQLTLLGHDEQEKCCRGAEAYRDIQRGSPYLSAESMEGACQIVKERQCAPEKHGAEKLGQLKRDLIAHLHYPNIRRRKPPCGAAVRSS